MFLPQKYRYHQLESEKQKNLCKLIVTFDLYRIARTNGPVHQFHFNYPLPREGNFKKIIQLKQSERKVFD